MATMLRKPTPEEIRRFRHTVRAFWRRSGRTLPWRETADPYAITVSEVMLQQTQVDRVVPAYLHFLRRFPTLAALEEAPLRAVVTTWQGLGYNRRAVHLKKLAAAVTRDYHGVLPATVAALETLPGIGPYTARAIAAFAYNQPHILIETNIRTVFIHTFFPKAKLVSDVDLLPLIEQTLDRRNPRGWYWALMDFGAYLKKQQPNPGRRSQQYVRQSPFQNSNRQLRGQIVRLLTTSPPQTAAQLEKATGFPEHQVQASLQALQREEMLVMDGRRFRLA